jgi:predicted O-linked N-acetylglucosamine transferase (SPINDLY family)
METPFFFWRLEKKNHTTRSVLMSNSEEVAIELPVDFDKLTANSTSKDAKSVNTPGSLRHEGVASDINEDTLAVVSPVVEKVLELTQNVETLTQTNENAKTDAHVKISQVKKAQKAVENAIKASATAKKVAEEATETATRVITRPEVSESTKKEARELVKSAVRDVERAETVKKKALEKKQIATQNAEKAVEKVKEVVKKNNEMVKRLAVLQNAPPPKLTGPTTTVQYEDYCVGVFTKEDDSKIVGVCPAVGNKCPSKWNDSDCIALRPVNTSLLNAPTTALW